MSDEKHPIIDRVFDKLELTGKVGVELFMRGAKGTKRALERTVQLIDEVGTYTERRLEELDGPVQKPAEPAESKPHEPARGEDGVLRDETFSFLDRPGDPAGGELEIEGETSSE